MLGWLSVAAVAWVGLALLDLAVRLALLRHLGRAGRSSLLWGLGFGLYLWAGLVALNASAGRALAFALVAGAAIALFVYLRGAGLESPPAARPGAFHQRLAARMLDSEGAPASTDEIQAAEERRWLTWFGIPALLAAVSLAIVFATDQAWILSVTFAAVLVIIGVLIWLTLSSDTNGAADHSLAPALPRS